MAEPSVRELTATVKVLIALALALVAACGKKDKSGETGSATPPAGSATLAAAIDAAPAPDAVAALTGPGYELAAANVAPPTGSLVGTDPPTAESLHLEMSYTLAKWAANPRDRSLYAKDFGGRDVPDARVDLVGIDEWIKTLPAKPAQLRNPSIRLWLDPGTQVTAGEAKVNVSYYYDGKDQYRELMWRREGKAWQLYKESTNSENHNDKFMDLRNWLPSDAKGLGKDITARFGIENTFAWLVLENSTGAQVVVDMWPWGTCTEVEAPKDALGKLTCKDAGEGKDFVLVKDHDELKLRIYPAGKDAPMSTDRSVDLAKGAKVTFKKTAAP